MCMLLFGKRMSLFERALVVVFDEQKAWETAQSPFKNLLMMGFMMWMSGSAVQLFSIGITLSALWQPVNALQGVNKGKTQDFELQHVVTSLHRSVALISLLHVLEYILAVHFGRPFIWQTIVCQFRSITKDLAFGKLEVTKSRVTNLNSVTYFSHVAVTLAVHSLKSCTSTKP